MDLRLIRIASGLNTRQRILSNALKTRARAASSVFDRHNLNDLSTILELDVSCRARLKRISARAPDFEIPAELNSVFIEIMNGIVEKISAYGTAQPSIDTLLAVSSIAKSAVRLSPDDIFAVISVAINTVAECITILDLVDQREIIKKLGRLLEIKELIIRAMPHK